MILLTILALILFILIGTFVLVLSLGGALALILGADIIACIAIVIWLIRKTIKRRRG